MILLRIVSMYPHMYIYYRSSVPSVNCTLKEKMREFTQQGHCERHMTAVHSGFVFRCWTCLTIFGRKNQKHGCVGNTLGCFKKETRTLEEEKYFEAFQTERGKPMPFMKPLPIIISDQPYQPGQTKIRTRFTKPPLLKKAKK